MEPRRGFATTPLLPSQGACSLSPSTIEAPLPLDQKFKQSPLTKWDETQLDGRKNAFAIFARFRSVYANAIFKDYETLRAIMDRHEALIRRQWKKKSHSERKKLLQKTWPYIPIKHRADFDVTRPLTDPRVDSSKEELQADLESCMWGDLNLEDLVQPESLPLLLSSRSSAHDPSCFADADLTRCRHALATQAVRSYRDFAMELPPNGHSVFRNEHTADTYGIIKQCGSDCTHSGLAACRIGFDAGFSVLLLEIQARIYNFTVEICKTVLHDKDPNELTGSHIPIIPRPVEDKTASLDSLKEAAARAPYRVPAEMDTDRMLDMVCAKFDAAEDHLHSMREDPAYFADALRDYEAHETEWMWRHPTSPLNYGMRKLGNSLIGYPVAFALFWSEVWSRLLQKLQNLVAILGRKQHKVEEELPPELEAAYKDALFYIKDLEANIANEMKLAFISSPNIRPMWDSLPIGNQPITPDLKVEERWRHKFSAYLALNRTDNAFIRDIVGTHVLLKDLDSFRNPTSGMDTDPCIDSYVAAMLSDLSIVAECRRQLALFHPWARHYNGFTLPEEMATHEARQDAAEHRYHDKQLEVCNSWVFGNTFPGILPDDSVDGILPLSEKLYYPTHKPREEDVEGYLGLRKGNGWRPGDHVQSLLDRHVERTPKWEPPPPPPPPHPPQEPAAPGQSSSPGHDTSGLAGHFAALPAAEEDRPRRFKPIEPKAKIKTRGVDRRSAGVFEVLFHKPGAAGGGEVKWTEFLHAMGSVGFQSEKLYGSVWQFSPAAGAAAGLKRVRAIQFHEPHPSSRLPFKIVRAMGQRMKKRFGLD
ncbi:hypothetical protein PG984_006013 [Apiospora sp. TS-2023a]